MFQKDPTLEAHQSFTFWVNGTKLQISSALIPQTYIEDPSRDGANIGEFTLLQSVAYNVRDCEERRELLRFFIGLLRRLDAADF